MQETLGLLSSLNTWYGKISAIIHGQIPGIWTDHSIATTKYSADNAKFVIEEFSQAVKIINSWLLSTINIHTWEGISSPSRTMFLKGLSPSQKGRLGLSVV
jgi:hypothetical protein